MRRSMVLGAAAVLSTITAVAMLATALVFIPAPAPRSIPTAGLEVVARFYAAVNHAIATGDPSALHAVVAPDFVERDPLPGVGPDRAGLEEYLDALWAGAPGTRLVAEEVVVAGDRAMARVAVQPGVGAAPWVGTVVEPPVWGPVDVFRIAGGQVVERRGVSDGLVMLRPPAETVLDLPAPAPRNVTVERLAVAAGARWRSAVDAPRLLLVETGTIRAEVAGAIPGAPSRATPAPAATATKAVPTASPVRRETMLGVGQTVVVPAGARAELTNDGAEEARLLAVVFAVPAAPGGPPPSPAPLPAGTDRTVLAGGLGTDLRAGPVTVAIGRMTLARGGRLDVDHAAGPILLAVDGGRLAVRSAGRFWARRGVDGMSAATTVATLAAGDGSLHDRADFVTLGNPGDQPAVALVVTLRQPLPSASGAPLAGS